MDAEGALCGDLLRHFADGLVGFGMLRESDEGSAGAQDAGLLTRNGGDGGAEVFLVVEGDVGDDRKDRLDDVDGVEAAAGPTSRMAMSTGTPKVSPSFIGEVEEGERGEGFEVAGMVGQASLRALRRGGWPASSTWKIKAGEVGFGDFGGGYRLGEANTEILELRSRMTSCGEGCGDTDAFGDAGEVGRGVEAGAEAGGREDGAEGGGGAALAVGSGDEDRGEAGLRVAEGVGEGAHVGELELAPRRAWGEFETERGEGFDRCSEGHGLILVARPAS